MQAKTTTINSQHWQNLTVERGLDPQWVEANVTSVNQKEASSLLYLTAKSGGMWIEGANGQGQFKPDKPWSDKQGKKAPKYRSANQDDYDAILPAHPHEPRFWTDIEKIKKHCYWINGVPCVAVTEGGIKAIMGCSHHLATVGLLGVEQGLTGAKNDVEGKRFLIPTLRWLAEQGFGFILIFDADCATNKNVIWAERKLASALEKFNVSVYSITGTWTEDQGKGMDDYIQNQGIEAFREKLIQAELVREKWQDADTPKDAPPRSGELGKELIEKYRTNWQYCGELSSWLIYEHESEGVWSLVSDGYIQHVILQELKARELDTFRTNNYISNVIGYLKDELFIEKWVEQSEKYLPFNNGVYDLESGKLHNHSPGFRLTWKLPRDYSILHSCFPTISQFLGKMASSQRDYKLLLYFMAAVLRGRYDLQKFLYLIGTGGTGKSTYNDLLTMVIGENNTTTQSLEELEDKHNIIDLFGKRLLALPDQTPITTRKNSNFKRLTGGDDLSGRRLYRDTANFKFKGMTLLTSNRPFVFPASTANWLHRRMILIECNNVIPKHQRDGRLINRMEKELPALTNYLLSISDKELENTLKGIDEPDLTLASWEHHCQSDGLAAFINDEIINDPEAVTPIGSNKDRWKDDKYNPHQSALYDAYCHYCRKTGRTAKTTQTFSSDFLEIAENILGWQVSRDRKKFGGKQERVISGVRLRTELDSNYPTVEEMLEGDNGDNGGTTKGDNLTNAQSPDISSIPEKGEKGDNLNCKKSKLEPSTSDATYRGLNTKSSDQAVTPVTPKAETPDTTESERVTTQNKGDNYDSYPATRSDDSRHKEKRANKCKKQLLACQTKADLDKFKTESGFSENEYKWVWHNLLTGKEKARINAIANTDQLDLSQASNKSAPPKLEDLAIGDKVWVKSCQVSGEIKKIDPSASKYTLQIDHCSFLHWFSLSDIELLD